MTLINISTKLSGPVTYVKPAINGTPVSEPRAMIIQGLGNETVSWKFNILDSTGNAVKNNAGIARDFEVATDRNFATKCAKPTVKIVDTTNPPVNTIDPKYVLPDYCEDTTVTSTSSSNLLQTGSVSVSSISSQVSSLACIPRPNLTDINSAVNAKFVFERVGETDPTVNPDGSRSISLFGPITSYQDQYSLALTVDPEFEDQLGTNGLPTGQKTTKAKNEAALEGMEVKFIDSNTMKRGVDASGNQTLGTDKISKYWLYDLSAGQIRSAIDGFCLATKFVNYETNKTTNKLVIKKCTTNNGTTSSISIDPTQDWEMPKTGYDVIKRLKPSNSEYCVNHTSETYLIYFDKVCIDDISSSFDVKSVVDLRNYNLVQKSAQDTIVSNKTALTKADGSVNLTYSRITNFDGSKAMTVVGGDTVQNSVGFRTVDEVQYTKGQYWYYEPSSKMLYSDYYNKCLATNHANDNPASVNNIAETNSANQSLYYFKTAKCDTTDNRQKFLFYKDPVNNYNTIRTLGVRDLNYVSPIITPTTTSEIEKDYANRFRCMSTGFATGNINNDNFDELSPKPCRTSPINNTDSAIITKSAAYAYRELFNINAAANSPTKPITSKALPLISIISKMDKNNKKWKLDVKDGIIGDNSQIQIWEAVDGNPNQTFSYNPETNEIYWEPERELGIGAATQAIKVKVPRDINTGTSITTVIEEIEVPISTYRGSKDMKCLAVAGNANDPTTYNTYKNQGVVVKPCDGSAKQRFEFTYLNNDLGKPIIKSLYSNTCIDSQGTFWTQWDNTLNGTKSIMGDCTGIQSQLYRSIEKGKLLADAKGVSNESQDKANQNIFERTFANIRNVVGNSIKANAQSTQGYFYISSFFNQNFVIDIPYNNVVDQQELWLYQRIGSEAQKWITTGNNAEIKNPTGKCFDSGNGQVGQALRIHQCTGSWNQRWTLYTDGTIKQPATGLCISLKTTGYVKAVPYADIKNGTPIKMAQCLSDNCSINWQVSGIAAVNTSIVDRDCMRNASIEYLPYLDPGSSYNNPGTSGSPLPNSNPNQTQNNPQPTTNNNGTSQNQVIINYTGPPLNPPTTNNTPPPYIPPTTYTPPQTTTNVGGTGVGIQTTDSNADDIADEAALQARQAEINAAKNRLSYSKATFNDSKLAQYTFNRLGNPIDQIKAYLNDAMQPIQYCLSIDGVFQQAGCVISSVFAAALENIKNILAAFFTGLAQGVSQGLTFNEIFAAIALSLVGTLINLPAMSITLVLILTSVGVVIGAVLDPAFGPSDFLGKIRILGKIIGKTIVGFLVGGLNLLIKDGIPKLLTTISSIIGGASFSPFAGQLVFAEGNVISTALPNGKAGLTGYQLFTYSANATSAKNIADTIDEAGVIDDLTVVSQYKKVVDYIDNLYGGSTLVSKLGGSKQIPTSWIKTPLSKNQGWKFYNPQNIAEEIRVYYPSGGNFPKPNGYFRWLKNRSYLDINGNIPSPAIFTDDQIQIMTHIEFPIIN